VKRNWNDWLAELAEEQRASRNAALEQAKDEAMKRGKEPFDLDTFDRLSSLVRAKWEHVDRAALTLELEYQ